ESPDVQILFGLLPSASSQELEQFVRRLGLYLGREHAHIRPALVPALRTDKDVLEWLEGGQPCRQISTNVDPARLRPTLESGGDEQSISIIRAAGDRLIARLSPSASGPLVLRCGGQELSRVQIVRRPRPVYREPPARFRAVVMPSRPTRAHLLGEACW